MYPSQTDAMQMGSLTDIRAYYSLPEEVWKAFTHVAGDPCEDMRLLAVLPGPVLSAALERAQLPNGQYLSAIQASHVGLVWNLSRRIQHTLNGGSWDSWKETSPFGEQKVTAEDATTKVSTGDHTERKLKMTILDQNDDGDFTVQTEESRARWYQQYVQVIGGWPPEEEDPTLEQLSALSKRIEIQDTAPYVDFAIFVPYGQKALKASKFRSFVLTASGYIAKELPGPANFAQWRTCYRLLKTALLMLDAVGLASLQAYENNMERLARTFPSCWHLIYSADEVARSAQANRVRSKILMDLKAGRHPPEGFSTSRPWDHVYGALARDEGFWQVQVVAPALSWIAAGSHGTPRTPAEQLVAGQLQGGLNTITPIMENSTGTKDVQQGPSESTRRRKRKWRTEQNGGENPRPSKGGNGEKGKGKGGGRSTAKQKCFSWNNGNGPCGALAPGQKCQAAVPRLHRCTICDSPGHPSKDCTKKDM
jgi:hypothetical protein